MTAATATIYLTPKEAAERLRSSIPTLARWRSNGDGPVFVKLKGKVLYRLSDIEAYLRANTRQSTRPTE